MQRHPARIVHNLVENFRGKGAETRRNISIFVVKNDTGCLDGQSVIISPQHY